ncbi:hypothetical protein TSTA_025760 [Talaromyces stipitatus ATCC 10500]|uniref:Uncharacterized protein n=1 Tax=Talaromyces stipitatus (strain ATCC 10500 / CBS 375.48 / QM 6759 / NRRL 1006) TaxID=441959 RepID=B8M685_TALSN|nr:uncharacterized protein TSTA_025760 [Talaromyces stipitatus ATCC 10500]EED19260.1 hypothetical protein TSTA_025760 [Talaromyces stipitatus ATCC 10500]
MERRLEMEGMLSNITFIFDYENRRIVHSSYIYLQGARQIVIRQQLQQMERNVQAVVDALSSRRINTLTELRRMERILLTAIQPHVTDLRESSLVGVLATAWLNYVQNHNLLSELRNLTRNYPLSSVMLDEAKSLVMNDPERSHSWNFAWLVLTKIEEEALATNADMWGGILPQEDMITMLEIKCREEWTRAVEIMLRHWDTQPVFPNEGD